MKPCLTCGTPAPGPYCERHKTKGHSSSSVYQRNARAVTDSAVICSLCLKGAIPGDPWTADHIVPRSLGGSDGLSNLQPAHLSCNSRKGARMTFAA